MQPTGCKRSVIATGLPAKFTLSVVRPKVRDSYLCSYICLPESYAETIPFSLRRCCKGKYVVQTCLVWLTCGKEKAQPSTGFLFSSLFDWNGCWTFATELQE